MDAADEQRLRSLEERLARIEKVLSLPDATTAPEPVRPSAPVWPPVPPTPAAAHAAPRAPRPTVDLEELLGGRVLAWLGGGAVVLGVVFFLVMAVSRGWIDEPTRVALAFAGSAALLGAALWLYERKGQTQAALAAAAAALASLYASLTAGTVVYDLIPDVAGLAVAGLVGAVGAAIAVRWSSQVVGGIGILGGLLAPVLVDAGDSSASLAFMAIALVAAVAVLVWQRWPWLAFASFVVSAPQLLAWIDEQTEDDHHLVRVLIVVAVFWALYLVAALGHELRVPTEKLRTSSALLLFADVLLVAGAGWGVLDDAGRTAEATSWVLAIAATHVAVGVAAGRGRVSREIGALLIALGTALSAIGFALALDGPALVAGWAAHAALLAVLSSRIRDERVTFGAAGFLGLAVWHVLLFEAPPDALANGLDHAASGLVGLAVVAAAAALAARFAYGSVLPWRRLFVTVGAATPVYLVSVAIVDAAGATDATGSTQGGQLLLSAFWSLTGLAAIVAGLLRDRRELRLAGLALLGIAVFKVFLIDLQTLDSLYRVGSFIALGLLLITGAFAYQRVRREVAE